MRHNPKDDVGLGEDPDQVSTTIDDRYGTNVFPHAPNGRGLWAFPVNGPQGRGHIELGHLGQRPSYYSGDSN